MNADISKSTRIRTRGLLVTRFRPENKLHCERYLERVFSLDEQKSLCHAYAVLRFYTAQREHKQRKQKKRKNFDPSACACAYTNSCVKPVFTAN